MTNNFFLETWKAYGAAWSEPNESKRKMILTKQLVTDCNYSDPNVDITGIDKLSVYMEEFQKSFPGAKFVVTDFKEHHNQSLAHWNMVDGNGNTLCTGASFGMYQNGQLIKMAGFF